jgi:hypothetical protein
MAKSLSLLLCCTLFACSVWAQTPQSDAVLLQKLQFKKVELGWTAATNYFPKKSFDPESDDVRSMMFVGPRKQDAVNMQLPELKYKKVDLRMKMGPREPLFRRQ